MLNSIKDNQSILLTFINVNFPPLFFKYLLGTVRPVAMGMVNVQEQDAGKDDYNSYISLQHHIVCSCKRRLACIWNNFWRWNFYDNFQM